MLKFQYTEEESDMCKREFLEFMETLHYECENKTILEVWHICHNRLEWHTNWPKLMQLWQKVIVLSSITIYERGFIKQNAIKSCLHNRLNSTTLDALLRGSLCGLGVDAMDWATIFNLEKHARPKDSHVGLIIQIFFLLKYCVTQN